MCRQRLSPVHLLLVVSLGPLMFSARLTWTQEMSPASQTPARVSVLAPQSVVVPEAGIRFNPAYEKLSLPFAPNQGSSLSVRIANGHHRLAHYGAPKISSLEEQRDID